MAHAPQQFNSITHQLLIHTYDLKATQTTIYRIWFDFNFTHNK